MSYQACEISTPVKNAKIIDLKNANRAMHKFKSSEVTLQFPDLGHLEKLSTVCFASFAALVIQDLQTLKMEDLKDLFGQMVECSFKN